MLFSVEHALLAHWQVLVKHTVGNRQSPRHPVWLGVLKRVVTSLANIASAEQQQEQQAWAMPVKYTTVHRGIPMRIFADKHRCSNDCRLRTNNDSFLYLDDAFRCGWGITILWWKHIGGFLIGGRSSFGKCCLLFQAPSYSTLWKLGCLKELSSNHQILLCFPHFPRLASLHHPLAHAESVTSVIARWLLAVCFLRHI